MKVEVAAVHTLRGLQYVSDNIIYSVSFDGEAQRIQLTHRINDSTRRVLMDNYASEMLHNILKEIY